MIEVLEPGVLSLVQDLGRPGLAALGVGPSGAADTPSLRLGNRLVGNDEAAAGLEVTLGGLSLRFRAATTVAVTGAPCPVLLSNTSIQEPPSRESGMNCPISLVAGATLKLGGAVSGVRTYVAVRGGVAVPSVLGSRSRDVLSGVGPAPLVAGQLLPIGPAPPRWPLVEQAPTPSLAHQPTVQVLVGPRAQWFREDAIDVLCAKPYKVAADSNRTALRLRGEALTRAVDDEVPPEGLVGGAIQVPPDGQPVLFLADRPVTGGYPVLAVVRCADLPKAAQLRPGQSLCFAVVSDTG